MIGIYKITSPSGNIYIGQSWNIEKRQSQYGQKLYNHQPILERSIKKYGWNNHYFEICQQLPEDINQSVIDDYEKLYLDLHKYCGLVIMNIREAGSRGKHSEESKKKISETRLRIGFKQSKESIEKILAKKKGKTLHDLWGYERAEKHIAYMKAKKGIPHSKEHTNKIAKSLTGKKLTEEHKAALRAAHKKRKNDNRK